MTGLIRAGAKSGPDLIVADIRANNATDSISVAAGALGTMTKTWQTLQKAPAGCALASNVLTLTPGNWYFELSFNYQTIFDPTSIAGTTFYGCRVRFQAAGATIARSIGTFFSANTSASNTNLFRARAFETLNVALASSSAITTLIDFPSQSAPTGQNNHSIYSFSMTGENVQLAQLLGWVAP